MDILLTFLFLLRYMVWLAKLELITLKSILPWISPWFCNLFFIWFYIISICNCCYYQNKCFYSILFLTSFLIELLSQADLVYKGLTIYYLLLLGSRYKENKNHIYPQIRSSKAQTNSVNYQCWFLVNFQCSM